MRKAIITLLIAGIIFSMTGCVGTQAPSQNTNTNQQNNTQYNTTANEPTVTALTIENLSNYLTISCDVHDIETENVGGVWRGNGKLTIKTSPKKRGDFSNVIIKVSEKRTGKGWEDYAGERTLEIPFDGKFEQTFNISGHVFNGNFISSSPYIEVQIVSVSGDFVEE